MENKLLPCPFCGKTEQEVSDVHISTGWESADICCEGCGAQVVRDGNTSEEARKNVIRAWNTRAERTCRMIDNGVELCCSECDARHDYNDEPDYCMGCGAKVVE